VVADALVIAVLVGDDGADRDAVAHLPNLERDVFRFPSAQLLFTDDLGRVACGFGHLDAAVVPVNAQPLAGGNALGPGESRTLATLELLGGERRSEHARGDERWCESNGHGRMAPKWTAGYDRQGQAKV
jgi:hypothetical protein